jgi:hypothetical protein
MMHHHDDLSMLMVEYHGCIGWWSWSMLDEKWAIFHQCSLLGSHEDKDIIHQCTLVALETQPSSTLVQICLSLWTKCFLGEASMLVLRAKDLYWFLSLLTTLSSAPLYWFLNVGYDLSIIELYINILFMSWFCIFPTS